MTISSKCQNMPHDPRESILICKLTQTHTNQHCLSFMLLTFCSVMMLLLLIRAQIVETILSSILFRCSLRVLTDDRQLLLERREQCLGSFGPSPAWLAKEKYHHCYNLF
jgi:hypothetical protein